MAILLSVQRMSMPEREKKGLIFIDDHYMHQKLLFKFDSHE